MSVTELPLIAQLVRETRQHLELTQEEFAVKLGVSYQSVNRWENGRTKPLAIVLKLIEEMLPKLGSPGFELLAKYFPDNMTASRKQ